MSERAKIVIAAAIGLGLFFAFNSLQTEYARITSRVETTQAKVDALADELQATTATIHAAIKSLADRFLAGESMEAEVVETIKAIDTLNDTLKEVAKTPTVPTILMHSSPTCGPCLKWKNNELERWTKAGWQVAVIDEEHCERAKWPWYEITDRDGKQFEVIGPLNNDNFQAAKRGK